MNDGTRKPRAVRGDGMSASQRRRESAAVPRGYVEALSKLFARSPAELEEQRQSRQQQPLRQLGQGFFFNWHRDRMYEIRSRPAAGNAPSIKRKWRA